VIDLRGAAVVQDFTLSNPARLVIDIQGARLTAPVALYDGKNRGGVRNIRYAQFKPDVVRIVIDLDALKDYQVERAAGQVRVRIGSERTAFAAWSSSTVTPAPVAVAEPCACTGGDRWSGPGRTVTTPTLTSHVDRPVPRGPPRGCAAVAGGTHHRPVGQREHRGRHRRLRGVQRPDDHPR